MRSEDKRISTSTILIVIVLIFLGLGGVVLLANQGTTADNQTFRYNTSSTSKTMQPTTSSKVNLYSAAPAALAADALKNKTAVISTPKGDITIKLFGEDTPLTVSNFIFLANSKFYDGLTFHRYVPGFVIQGGDPAGNGTGGPGYTVPAEIKPNLKHVKGAVAMARLGDDINPTKASSGSQFYIMLEANADLDGGYTVFGVVTSGLDVVEKLRAGDKINSVVIQ